MLLDSQEHAAIERLKSQLTTAIGASDVPAIAGLYVDDAVVLAPRREIVRGPNIRRFWRNMSTKMKNVKFVADELTAIGVDAVRETGSMSFEPADGDSGNSEPILAKYLLIWQKQAGQWKLAAMSWSRIAGNQPSSAGAQES